MRYKIRFKKRATDNKGVFVVVLRALGVFSAFYAGFVLHLPSSITNGVIFGFLLTLSIVLASVEVEEEE